MRSGRKKSSRLAMVVLGAAALVIACGLEWLGTRRRPTPAVAGATGEGVVAEVKDGDSFEMRQDGSIVRVRLYGIDCPEYGQPWGDEAKAFTEGMVLGRKVVVESVARDTYGRMVAEVTTADGRNLSRELLANGHAWWYQRHAESRTDFADAEKEARRQRLGLWAGKDPVAPWDWRRRHKSSRRRRSRR